MPEKVTSLNGLKVTLEYGSYKLSTHNVRYVKCALYIYESSPIMGGKIRSYCLVRGETLI